MWSVKLHEISLLTRKRDILLLMDILKENFYQDIKFFVIFNFYKLYYDIPIIDILVNISKQINERS